MEKQRRANTVIVCGLMLVIAAMSVGFAALSQRLDINGTAVVKSASNSWNVYFSDVNTTGGEVGSGKWTSAPSVSTDTDNTGSNNKISFACELVAPGDACSVTATVKNGGTIAAKYTGYTFKVDGKAETGTSVTLDSGAVVTITPAADWTEDTTVLNQNDSGTFIVKMELPTALTSLPSAEKSHKVELSINFVQNQ